MPARAVAEEKRAGTPVIQPYSRSLITPFPAILSPPRSARKAFSGVADSRGANGGETRTTAASRAEKPFALREELGQASAGYRQTFAAYKAGTEMAKTAKGRASLALWMSGHLPKHRQRPEPECLTRMMHDDGVNGDLAPWDWRLLCAKTGGVANIDLDEAALKPLFSSLDRMIDAAFDCATRLFSLRIQTPSMSALYPPDCRAWDGHTRRRTWLCFIG